MLHLYWFNYAGKTFRGVLKKDPACAMAYWGIALDLLGNTLSSPPSAQAAREAWELLEKARGVAIKTERERLWLDAIRAYFRDYDKVPVERGSCLQQRHAAARGTLSAGLRGPGLLRADAPGLRAEERHDLRQSVQVGGDARKVYTQQPQHPGITHYLIHAYDFAPFADKGIPAARRYASIAPAVPHARHMPAHIYSMVGMWQDSITSNLSALEIQPDYYHAADFTVYAHCSSRRTKRREDDREGAGHTGARRPSAEHGELHREGRDAGALRARARGLESGGGVAADADRVSASRLVDALHARPRPGAARRSRRRGSRD